MDRHRIRKPGRPPPERPTVRRCPSCRKLPTICDCRHSRSREGSGSSNDTSSVTESSPRTVDSKATTPGDLGLVSGSLGPLSAAVTAAFFAFVGDSPSPITDVFSISFIRPYLETSVPVRAVVSTIGKICLEFRKGTRLDRRNAAAAAIMNEDRAKLQEYLQILTGPDSHDQHVILLYGLLLAYAEVMTCDTWVYFQATFRKLSGKIREQLKQRQRKPLLYFDKGLLMNFSMMGGFYALLCFGDTFLVDVELYDPTPFENIDSLTNRVRVNSAIFHHYNRFMERFARLHHRAFKWVQQARRTIEDRHLSGETPDEALKAMLAKAGLLQAGKDIVESSGAVVDVMENLRGEGYEGNEGNEGNEDDDSTDFCVLREAYYHYSLMGLTRTFWDPVWRLVDEDLPQVGSLTDLEAHGVLVRERIAQRLPVVGMESWSYLVILIGLALESRTTENQKRVAGLFRDIMEKGFAISGAFLADTVLIWGMDYTSTHEVVGPLA